MIIKHNIPSSFAHRYKSISDKKLSKKITNLSSGYRINSAADDAAGLAISEKMRAQIRGMNQAARNTLDAISLIQTAEGGLQTITDIIHRMRELAVQAASDTLQTGIDRDALNEEYQNLKEEINMIATGTSFNGITPLGGDAMTTPQNAVWFAELLSDDIVYVDITAYNPTPPTSADVSDVQKTLNSVAAVSVSATTVSVTAGTVSVGTVSTLNDIVAVTNVTGATSLPSVGSSTLTISAGDTYQITAANLSGVTDIVVGAGAKLIIQGDVGSDLKISGDGEVRINGSAAGLTVDPGSKVSVTGNVTGNVTNNGTLTVGGNVAGNVINNSNIMINGTVSSITNAAGANAELKTAAGAAITNLGNMEISGASTSTNVNNQGNILFSGGSGVTVSSNTGKIESWIASTIVNANTGELLLSGSGAKITNNAGGKVYISGSGATVVGNSGDIEISGTGATVENNNSKIRVSGSGATIKDNNSDILITGSGATVEKNQSKIHVSGTGATIKDNNSDIEISGSGATVSGNSHNILITGNNANITGNTGDIKVEGDGVDINGNSSKILVTGNNAEIFDNGATGHIEARGNNARVDDNHGKVLMSGLYSVIDGNNGDIETVEKFATVNDNNGNILMTASHATVNDNHGDIVVNGSDTLVNLNNGKLYSDIALHIVTNEGKVFCETDDVILDTNNGTAKIDGDKAKINTNNGVFEITGDDTHVAYNYSTGELTIKGVDTHINNNYGLAFIDGNDTTVDLNTGDMRIYGSRAKVTNYGNLFVNGNDATILNSGSGLAHVVGNYLTLTNNGSAKAKIEGHYAKIISNAIGAIIDLDGHNSEINNNDGKVEVNGQNTVVKGNDGELRIESDTNAKVTDNSGRIEVANGVTITDLVNQTGTILVESGGRINDADCINDGRIEVEDSANINIHTNNNTVVCRGTSIIDTNKGYLEVGSWDGDSNTPADGSDDGSASVKNNLGGIIRNFSKGLFVETNTSGPLHVTNLSGCLCIALHTAKEIRGGIIENYGSMNANCVNKEGQGMQGLIAEIYHHARQVDTSGIDEDGGNVIEYTANGDRIPQTGQWQSVVGSSSGHQLEFDEYTHDNGLVTFSAGPDYEVPGVIYDIQERRSVSGSSGTSGQVLLYLIPSGFRVQTGANFSDSMTIDFTTMSTEALATLIDSECGCLNCACTLETTTVELGQTATCAIENCDQALADISLYRAKLGAIQNRLEFRLRDLELNAENLIASESRIRDADLAKETSTLTKNQILVQSATAMMTQANAIPQSVLQLLG